MTNIVRLPWIRHCSVLHRHLSFDSNDNPMRMMLLLTPFDG